MRYEKWTDANVKTLSEMFLMGRSYTEIAAALGRTNISVANKIRVLGLAASTVDEIACGDADVRRRSKLASEALLKALWREHPEILRKLTGGQCGRPV